MSDFDGMEDMLQDFLTEASDLLSGVDNKLVDLEKRPDDKELLNEIFRGFHTIKGGAGFLNASEMVALCPRTENLFDKLRNGELQLDPSIMDVIMSATGIVRDMFGDLSQNRQPSPADPAVLSALDAVLSGQPATVPHQPESTTQAILTPAPVGHSAPTTTSASGGPDWDTLYHGLIGGAAPRATAPSAEPVAPPPMPAPSTGATIAPARAASKGPTSPAAAATTKMQGNVNQDPIQSLDEAVSQLDLLVGDLQSAVMKTRMQPIGRLFQKYPRLARDLARQLGKDVELLIEGEETEIDKTMIEDLNDPIVHLVRNAVDHGVESTQDRIAAGKPAD